jgi:hypothetical protein
MNPSVEAIQKLYQLKGADFDRRLGVMATNLKARTLESFVKAPAAHNDVEQVLGDLSAGLIETQKKACAEAKLTADQNKAFERWVDDIAAEAIMAIRKDTRSTTRGRQLRSRLRQRRRCALQCNESFGDARQRLNGHQQTEQVALE